MWKGRDEFAPLDAVEDGPSSSAITTRIACGCGRFGTPFADRRGDRVSLHVVTLGGVATYPRRES
jgi:hypothetical protein